MLKNRIFKGIIKIEFWIGVNVIGIPIIHTHELAKYQQQKTQFK
jgi:hypothetical protein